MPEGHTLHRLAARIEELFVGRPWSVSSPQGRFEAGAAQLDGRIPHRAEAWGKHLFVHVDDQVWHVHLGLYGAFTFGGDESFLEALGGTASLGAPRIAAADSPLETDEHGWVIPEPPRGAVRARLRTRHGWADLRGPATCQVLTAPELTSVLKRLGPDPLRSLTSSTEPGVEAFLHGLSTRRIPVAQALMDQRVIAGVGNIYRAESLFLEQIDPGLAARDLDQTRARALWNRLTQQLQDGVAEGIIRTLRGAAPTGSQGTRRHWVYQHQGTGCLRCGSEIRRAELAGRMLYWCPGCQTH